MRRHAGAPLSLLVWAVLLTGLMLAVAAAPGTLALRHADAKRVGLERAIELDQRAANGQRLSRPPLARERRHGWR